MGRYCRICGRIRPHEKFGGKGRRRYICRDCRQRPKAELRRILCEQEIWGFWEQSNISKKNMRRLKELTRSTEQHNDWDAFDWQDARIEAGFHTYVSFGPDEILNGWCPIETSLSSFAAHFPADTTDGD